MLFSAKYLFIGSIELGSDDFISVDGKNLHATKNPGNVFSEGIGCKCNCRGVCEPKGCKNMFGRKIQSKSIL